MNPPLLIQLGTPDPNSAPTDFTQEVALLNTLLTGQIVGSYIPYVIGSDTPSVDDNDKAWIELDTAGRPIAVKTFYNGNWRRVYNGAIGDVKGYTGDPSVDFDTDGLGIVGGRQDGWHLMNGNGGTANLTDKFLVGAHMDNSNGHTGYNSGWQTFVDGMSDLQTGGGPNIQLNAANTYQPPIVDVKVDKYSATGNTNDPSGILYGVNSVQHIELFPGSAGVTSPPPITTLPPFYCLAWVTFVGYS